MDSNKKEQKDHASQAEQYLIADPEGFLRNLARMAELAGEASAAWSDRRQMPGDGDPEAAHGADLVRTLSKITEYWLADPSRALEAQTRLFAGFLDAWTGSVQRLMGQQSAPVAEPEARDRRFQDPEWSENAFFDFLKQTYLIAARWAGELVEHSEGLDDATRAKAHFYVNQLTAAMSPSNFIPTNPVLLRETARTSGENLVRGLGMLAEDIRAGGGELKLRQADDSAFVMGKTIAATPGKVVARSDIAEIIQYEAMSGTVLRRPLVITPPWINKFYILDLSPEKSFIRWAVEQGHTVFVVSWVNPDERHAEAGWEEYFDQGIDLALRTAETVCGTEGINVIGYCVGGTLLAACLALMARRNDTRVRSATFFAAQVDFTHAGDLKFFVDEEQVHAIEQSMKRKGYLEGTKMAKAFNMLRANELIWPYVVNNYLLGKQPTAFDLLYWNSDSTRMTAANHSFYLRNCYLENNLSGGRMELAGERLSLSDIKLPVYMLATRDDHISPARSVYAGSRFFGGDVEFVLSGSGHIAGVINPPAAAKYQYWTDGPKESGLEEWLQGATEHPGSWWPHWQQWILSRDDVRVPARSIGGGKLPALADSPGEYVRVRI